MYEYAQKRQSRRHLKQTWFQNVDTTYVNKAIIIYLDILIVEMIPAMLWSRYRVRAEAAKKKKN